MSLLLLQWQCGQGGQGQLIGRGHNQGMLAALLLKWRRSLFSLPKRRVGRPNLAAVRPDLVAASDGGGNAWMGSAGLWMCSAGLSMHFYFFVFFILLTEVAISTVSGKIHLL
jgi:hypothetical protein